MKNLLLIFAITMIAGATECPYESWEEFECYAEAGQSCEELMEQCLEEEQNEKDEE